MKNFYLQLISKYSYVSGNTFLNKLTSFICHCSTTCHQLTVICLLSLFMVNHANAILSNNNNENTLLTSPLLEVSMSKQPSTADKILTLVQIKSDLSLVQSAYSKIHPGYLRYADANSLNEAWQSIIEQAEANNGMTLGNFYLAIQKVLVKIRCDHTKVNLPNALKDERDSDAYYLPIKWEWLENRAIITKSDPGQQFERLDEIVSVDGKSIQRLVDDVLAYIPYDGNANWSANTGVASSLEFKGGAVDHFGSLLWGYKPKATVEIKRKDGSLSTIVVNRINYKQWEALAIDKSAMNFKDAVTFERIGDDIAYVRVDTFVNYRTPVDPSDIYDPIFKAIKKEARKIVIIDLRKNGGGSSDASHGLFANLIQKPTEFHTDMQMSTLNHDEFVDHITTWDKRAINPNRLGFRKNDDGTYSLRSLFSDDLGEIKPAKYAFEGHVIALTSSSNSSGSTNLLSILKSNREITLIGERSGGNPAGPTAGVLFYLTLPESDISARIPVFKYTNNVNNIEDGSGLVPDIYAPKTVNSLMQESDPAYEKAIKHAKELIHL